MSYPPSSAPPPAVLPPRPGTTSTSTWLSNWVDSLRPGLAASNTAIWWAIATGIGSSILFRSGAGGVGVPLFIGLLCLALIVGRRIGSRQSKAILAVTFATSCVWIVRSSWWVLIPAWIALLVLPPAAALFARNGSIFDRSWISIGGMGARLAAHAVLVFPWLVLGVSRASPRPNRARAWTAVRALAIALPVVVVFAWLLTSADPIFAAIFRPDVAVEPFAVRLFLFIVGVGVLAFLWRTSAVPNGKTGATTSWLLGRAESVTLLVAVSSIFVCFIGIQIAAALGMGEQTLAERNITVADYARSGYFQLLAVVFLTSVILVTVDALRGSDARPRRAERGLSVLIVLLALAIAATAMQRLALYVDTYGLTMLRLSCVPGAVWMTILLLLVVGWVTGVHRTKAWLPGAAAVALVATMLAFAAVNPEAMVVRFNVDHADESPLDLDYLTSLSNDAVPALIDAMPGLDPEQQLFVRNRLCQRPLPDPAWSMWSAVSTQTSDDLNQLCSDSERPFSALP